MVEMLEQGVLDMCRSSSSGTMLQMLRSEGTAGQESCPPAVYLERSTLARLNSNLESSKGVAKITYGSFYWVAACEDNEDENGPDIETERWALAQLMPAPASRRVTGALYAASVSNECEQFCCWMTQSCSHSTGIPSGRCSLLLAVDPMTRDRFLPAEAIEVEATVAVQPGIHCAEQRWSQAASSPAEGCTAGDQRVARMARERLAGSIAFPGMVTAQ